MLRDSHPILSCAEAKSFETNLFHGEEANEWKAMQCAGRAIGRAVLSDSQEIGGFAASGRILVLVGKGHNGGDALIAAATLLGGNPAMQVEVVFGFGARPLRPLAVRAWQELAQKFGDRCAVVDAAKLGGHYDLCLDGIFGFQFRPPLAPAVAALIERVNALPVRMRAAVDLPSGGVFRADFTYATGAVKTPALTTEFAGRLRYLDLGFFSGETRGNERVLTSQILAPLAAFRSPQSDKRSYGHLFVVAGSRSFPGAPMLTVLAALRSGVGLLTAFVPESLVSAYAARVPEAIWVGWPETPDGGLALEGLHLLRERIDRADALVIGPGISRETETLAMVTGLVKAVQIPVLLDADALQPEVIREAKSPLVLTPHAGEYARIGGTGTIEEFAASTPGAVVVLKGPLTRIVVAEIVSDDMTIERSQRCVTTYHSLFGGPVLARGGSGDLLAGIIGAMLAQTPLDPVLAAARGTVWHGLAADLLAQSLGQVAVTTTQLLDFMPAALRDSVRELGGSE